MEFLFLVGVLNRINFITAWDKLCLTLEDFLVLTSLSLLREARTITLPEHTVEVTLDEEEKRMVEALNKELLDPKISNKSTCSSCARLF